MLGKIRYVHQFTTTPDHRTHKFHIHIKHISWTRNTPFLFLQSVNYIRDEKYKAYANFERFIKSEPFENLKYNPYTQKLGLKQLRVRKEKIVNELFHIYLQLYNVCGHLPLHCMPCECIKRCQNVSYVSPMSVWKDK